MSFVVAVFVLFYRGSVDDVCIMTISPRATLFHVTKMYIYESAKVPRYYGFYYITTQFPPPAWRFLARTGFPIICGVMVMVILSGESHLVRTPVFDVRSVDICV